MLINLALRLSTPSLVIRPDHYLAATLGLHWMGWRVEGHEAETQPPEP